MKERIVEAIEIKLYHRPEIDEYETIFYDGWKIDIPLENVEHIKELLELYKILTYSWHSEFSIKSIRETVLYLIPKDIA